MTVVNSFFWLEKGIFWFFLKQRAPSVDFSLSGYRNWTLLNPSYASSSSRLIKLGFCIKWKHSNTLTSSFKLDLDFFFFN